MKHYIEAVDYFKWVRTHSGEMEEHGVTALITDKLEQEGKEWGEMMAKGMVQKLAHEIFLTGRRPMRSNISLERDCSIRGNELSLVTETMFEGTKEEYLAMSFHAWTKEQELRKWYERLSLWGHIREWWRWRSRKES